MFLRRVGANDERFRTLTFHDGLNIVVADRTAASDQGDSRNSIGKSSLVRILRYLLSSNAPDEFKGTDLKDHVFEGWFTFPNINGDGTDDITVNRWLSPTTRLSVRGWSAVSALGDIHIDEWRSLVGQYLFHIPEGVTAPTSGQLWGQLIRTHFGDPTKSHPTDPGWVTGVKLGYFLGLSPEVLGRAGEVERLDKQRKVIRQAVREGVMGELMTDEADLRARLAVIRRDRDRISDSLRSFKVDEQYASHQRAADRMTFQISRLNDEGLSLERRRGELMVAMRLEQEDLEATDLQARLARVYGEVNVVLPDTVARRYEEVAQFHASVVRNRQTFLEEELNTINRRLAEIEAGRTDLDGQRAEILRLLSDTVALDTFLDAQRSLAATEAQVSDLERRLLSAVEINQIDTRYAIESAETVAAVRAEFTERTPLLDRPIALFSELGSEIYSDRESRLLIQPTTRGQLSVTPQIRGDASEGIKGVETYLLDMICLISGLEFDRVPPILVHDSHLFDSIDHRQVASCLNIGARLADQYGFQYIVTMNSDVLESVNKQSDGAFDSSPYELDVRLEDRNDEGGLFGFRFS
jgi:uncharacterized protein YydD (DUF2326 family)